MAHSQADSRNAIVRADESGHRVGYCDGYPDGCGGDCAGYGGGCAGRGDCQCRASPCQCVGGKTSRYLRWCWRRSLQHQRRRFLWGLGACHLGHGKHVEKPPATSGMCNCLCTKPTFMRLQNVRAKEVPFHRCSFNAQYRQRMRQTYWWGKMLASKKKEIMIQLTPWSKYMALSPKGRLIQGLWKPIHDNCAIYFCPGVYRSFCFVLGSIGFQIKTILDIFQVPSLKLVVVMRVCFEISEFLLGSYIAVCLLTNIGYCTWLESMQCDCRFVKHNIFFWNISNLGGSQLAACQPKQGWWLISDDIWIYGGPYWL